MTQGALSLAESLRSLSHLAEIRGSHGEASDLARAHAAIEALAPAEVTDLLRRTRRDTPAREPGIAPAVLWRLHDLAARSPRAAVRAAVAGAPALIRRLLENSTITSGEACRLVSDLGVVTYPDLVAALEDSRVQLSLGDLADRLRAAAKELTADLAPTTLGRALDLIDRAIAVIRAECPAIDTVEPSGDARRFSSHVSGVIIAARAADPVAAMDQVCATRALDDVPHRGAMRAIVSLHGAEIDLRLAAPHEYGTVQFLATGTRAHVQAVQQRRAGGTLFTSEEDVYAHASLPFIAPELREGATEVTVAAAGELPALVSRAHIRGDLHLHSTWSDGRDTIEAMVQASRALGYEYIVITDHSERAMASRTVARDQLAWQRDEIDLLRERYPDITILHGIEVDILAEGTLDFPDALLEPLDIVLASLHEQSGHDGPALTRRYLAAMQHPLVTVITHPANRLPGRHEGYALDFEALYAAAAETGTALEIDGGPGHLDLDGPKARAAVAAGVTLVIDSDCHRAQSLDRQMRMGVGTARRGWVETGHVLNTRPLEEVREFAAAKRLRQRLPLTRSRASRTTPGGSRGTR